MIIYGRNWIKEIPENITPMVCQAILKASQSGNEYIRESTAFCIRKINGKIKNDYWSKALENRLLDLQTDDSRLVRNSALQE